MASDLLFERRIRLTIVPPAPKGEYGVILQNVKVIEGLRMAFGVKKTLTEEPNQAQITVTNLSEESRGVLQGKGFHVILEAGYNDKFGVIFSGDSRYINHVKNGPDWDTTFECGDGERAYKFSRVNLSFSPKTDFKEVLKKVWAQTKQDPGNLFAAFQNETTQLMNGYTAKGKAATEFTKLLKSRGFEWSIQNGKLQVKQVGQLAAGVNPNDSPVLTPETGLIGSPEAGDPKHRNGPGVVKIKALLSPLLRPGGLVALESRGFRGKYEVLTVAHSGDTAGIEWYTTVEARPI